MTDTHVEAAAELAAEAAGLVREVAIAAAVMRSRSAGSSHEGAVADRLAGLMDELGALRRELADVIGSTQQDQIADLVQRRGDDVSAGRLRLHIGAAGRRIDGWISVDVDDADVLADISRPLPFPTGCASHVYASHVLEHLAHPDEAWRFLRECRRVLRLGGKIRVVVPDLEVRLRAYVDRDEAFWRTHEAVWPWSRDSTPRLDQILRYAGTGVVDPFGHRHGYDAESLRDLMTSAGLVPVRSCGYQASPDPVFAIDDASAVAFVHHGGRPLSLFAEGFHLF